jgi:hypothetical protein
MPRKTDHPADRLAYAAQLEKQIQALGGYCGGEPGFKEHNTDLAIEFYERVLAEDRRINGPNSSNGVN